MINVLKQEIEEPSKKIAGVYVRVSTEDQRANGLSLDEQEERLFNLYFEGNSYFKIKNIIKNKKDNNFLLSLI